MIKDQTFIDFLKGKMQAADPAHDLQHIRRVVNSAGMLAKKENADQEIVRCAAWLHDCVTMPKNHPDRKKSSVLAGKEAAGFLKEQDCESKFIRAVVHAIEAHSFSAGIIPQTIEAKVVQDADRLDALGAAGLARCFMTGGSMGSGLAHPDEPFPEHREPDDKNWCVDHFYTKLLRLQHSMQTASGKKLAEKRSEILTDWLEAFREEAGLTRIIHEKVY